MASPQSLRKPAASNGFRDGPARLDVLGLVPIVTLRCGRGIRTTCGEEMVLAEARHRRLRPAEDAAVRAACARMKDEVILRVSKPARMGIDDSGLNAVMIRASTGCVTC